jgi:hypothetical protein
MNTIHSYYTNSTDVCQRCGVQADEADVMFLFTSGEHICYDCIDEVCPEFLERRNDAGERLVSSNG